jgi:hypothetical protein
MRLQSVLRRVYTYPTKGGRMTRRLLTATAVLFASILSAPRIGHAQTFKVEKFDIKGDGGTDYVSVEAATGRVFVSRGTHVMVVVDSGRWRSGFRNDVDQDYEVMPITIPTRCRSQIATSSEW